MARPKKYTTEEERLEARREQTRKNVRNHRNKKRSQYEDGDDGFANWREWKPPQKHVTVSDGSMTVQSETFRADADADAETAEEYVRTTALACLNDFTRYSARARIDLHPGVISRMALDLEAIHLSFPYMSILEELGSTNEMVRLGTFGFAAMYLGQMKQDQCMLDYSQAAYKKILPGMRVILEKPEKDSIKALISIVVNTLLKAIEVATCFFGPDRNSKNCKWIVHHRYQPKIVEACGARAFQHPLGRHLLRLMRPRIVFISLYTGQPVFLDSERWRQVPFGVHLTIQDQLWHIVETLPGLIQRARNVQLEDDCIDEVRAVWADMINTKQRLELWLEDLTIVHGEILFPYNDMPFAIDVNSKAPAFPCMAIACQLNTYWLYTFILRTVTDEFRQKHLSILNPQSLSDAAPLTHQHISAITWRVCQTLHYLFHTCQHDVEILMYQVCYPNRMLMEYFGLHIERYGIQYRWCSVLSRSMCSSQGPPLGACSEFFFDGYFPPDVQRATNIWSVV